MNSPTKEQMKELMGYLGQTLSVPQVVQNFQPSDTYLLGERMIGRWVNGKPIYRYVLDCSEHEINLVRNTTSNGRIDGILQDNNNTKRVDNFLDHPEQFISAHCWTRYGGGDDTTRYQSNCIPLGCDLDTNDNTLDLYTFGYWNPSQVDYLQIDYTKTTDEPTAYKLGSPYDYSLDETIIGSWIDGRPVYQKTFVTTMINDGESFVAFDRSNFDKILEITGIHNTNDLTEMNPVGYLSAIGICYRENKNAFRININYSPINESVIFTVRYIK